MKSSLARVHGRPYPAAVLGVSANGMMAPEAYRSGEFYRAEIDWVFPASWVFVGHERWVPAPGDYLAETIGEEPVLVIRNTEGDLQAFSNVCPHRASLLVEGRGNCDRRLVCPYHGWTFGLDGRLLAIPRQRGFVSPVDVSEYGLRELRLDVWEGLVFVNVTGDAPPLLDYLEDVPDLLGGHDIASMHLGEFLDDPIAANWKLVMDNAVCDYHLDIVHRESIAALVDMEELTARAGTTTAITSVPWKESQLPPEPHPGLAGAAAEGSLGCFVFPNLHVIGFPTKGATIMWWTPTGPATTRARVLGLSHDADADVRSGKELLARVQREDFDVCERMQIGVQSRGYAPGPQHATELRITAFQRRLLQMVQQAFDRADDRHIGVGR